MKHLKLFEDFNNTEIEIRIYPDEMDLMDIFNICDIMTINDPRLGAYIDGKLVGGTTYYIEDKIYTFDIAILPEYQGYGISKKLIEAIIEDAKKTNCKMILVEIINKNLYNYLLKKGFKKTEDVDVLQYKIRKTNKRIDESYQMINEDKVVNFDEQNGNFVITMAGPGAGKSTIVNNLINLNNYKHVNIDHEREILAKKLGMNLNNPDDNDIISSITHSSNHPGNRTINHLKLMLRTNKRKDNIVFDTTGTHINLMKEIIDLAKDNGYKITLVYIYCEFDKAIERNNKRERKLPIEKVIKHHNMVDKSFSELEQYFDHVYMIDNTIDYDVRDLHGNIYVKKIR